MSADHSARSKTVAVRELASLKVVIGEALGLIDEPKAGAKLAGKGLDRGCKLPSVSE